MNLLRDIDSAQNLKRLPLDRVPALAGEIRQFLIESVCRTGGHLGANLGTVELAIALHRVFDSPHDAILWDTGHQTYTHKILTGRQHGFARLRKKDGLSGYPSRSESSHDVVENSHASTTLSYADGLAKGRRLRGATGRAVVAVIGDGALTGGLAWEALNNIAVAKDSPVIIVLNDNGRSYAPTVGGIAEHLADLRKGIRHHTSSDPHPPEGAPGGIFRDLGLEYIGPVDGHDVGVLENALRRAADERRPVVVHCVTVKGRGYPHAEQDEDDRFHAVGHIDPVTGRPVSTSGPSWTSVFGAEMLRLAEERRDVVAVTAAMLRPAGLGPMAARFPDRVLDVGIAEQHAVTFAAGLAMTGLRPVVAVYSTFLTRAFDQVLLDVALHSCPVVFVLDRAGVTGEDGPSHNGMWDLSLFQLVPGLRIAAPRDAPTLRSELREAVAHSSAPSLVRYPKGVVGADLPAVEHHGGVDVLRTGATGEVLLVSVGALAQRCLQAADHLAVSGVDTTVVDPLWVKPISRGLIAMAARHRLVVTVEDNTGLGGFGSALAQHLRARGIGTPLLDLAVPQRFLPQGEREQVLDDCGLSGERIAEAVLQRVLTQEGRFRVPANVAAP